MGPAYRAFGCSSQVWRAGRPGTAARPARFASASKPAPTTAQIHVDLPQGPPGLDRAPQPSARPLAGCTALRFWLRSAASRTRPAENHKHELGQAHGRLQRGEASAGYVYLIGTVENRHPRPLTPRDCRVPAQQLSRYAGEVACPAGGRRGDNLRTSGQVDSGVRARRCIRRPGWVMWARGRAGEVERWRHTCAVTSSSPPSRRPDRRLFRSRGGEARSRTTPPAKLTLPAAPP